MTLLEDQANIKKQLYIDKLKEMTISAGRKLTNEEVLLIIPEKEFKQYFLTIDGTLTYLCYTFTKKELSELLICKATQLGKPPYKSEMDYPPVFVYIDVFGSWKQALEEVGLKDIEPPEVKLPKPEPLNPRKTFWNKEKILEVIRKTYEKSGIIPKESHLEGISNPTIKKYFGSYENALIESGLQEMENKIKEQTKEKNLIELKDKLIKLGKCSIPLLSELIKNEVYKDDKTNEDLLSLLTTWKHLLKSSKVNSLIPYNANYMTEFIDENNINEINAEYLHLRDLLRVHNIKQVQFANEIGISKYVVRKWCNKKGSYIYDDILEYIATKFNVSKELIVPQKKLKHVTNSDPRYKNN